MPAEQKVDGLEALQRELDKSQAENVKLTKQLETKPAPAAGNGPPTKAQIEEMFWKDPVGITDQSARRAAWESEQRTHAATIDTAKALAKKEARGEGFDAEIFDKFEVDIEAAMGSVQPQFHGNVTAWKNAVKMVKGDHLKEIMEMQAERNKPAEGEVVTPKPNSGDGPAPPSRRAAPAPKEEPLSSEEKEVAKGMGLTDVEYKRGKSRYANQEEEWAKVVTFSSEDKRRAAAAKRKAS